jgi:Flp pilus assembly protein TadD
MQTFNDTIFFSKLLSSTKLCGGTLIMALSFALLPNAPAYSSSTDKYNYSPNYVSNRVIAPSRYRTRPRDSVPIVKKESIPPFNVVAIENNFRRKDGLYQRPKTELSIRPIEYYNDAVQTQPAPVLQPSVKQQTKYALLPWLQQSNDVAPKAMMISETVARQPEPEMQQQSPLQKIEPQPIQKVEKVEVEQKLEPQPQQLARLDLSRQPVQVEAITHKEDVAKPILQETPKENILVDDVAKEEPVIKEVLLPKQFVESESPKSDILDLPALNQNNPKQNVVEKQEFAIERIEEYPEIQTSAPQPQPISNETKNILQKLPREIFPQRKIDNSKVDLERAVTSENNVGGASDIQSSVEATVAVRRQAFDVNYELDKAYNALVNGNTEVAVRTYRDVLANEPNNKFALFGLATTYHKLDMLDKARPLYGRLLEIDPYNKEALNNFLALVGEEAPESAIMYLEQLKSQNNDFSPIYAQLAQLYAKSGNMPLAIENMQEASMISPENLVYKYNLAVLYDKAKQKDRAIILYRQLMKAGLDGADLPANLSDIQKRLTFLSSNNG